MKTGKAIEVRYVGPTNNLGSRWIATSDHPISRVVVPYNHALDSLANAQAAALELVRRWNVASEKRAEERGDSTASIYFLDSGASIRSGYVFIANAEDHAF